MFGKKILFSIVLFLLFPSSPLSSIFPPLHRFNFLSLPLFYFRATSFIRVIPRLSWQFILRLSSHFSLVHSTSISLKLLEIVRNHFHFVFISFLSPSLKQSLQRFSVFLFLFFLSFKNLSWSCLHSYKNVFWFIKFTPIDDSFRTQCINLKKKCSEEESTSSCNDVQNGKKRK